MVWARLWAALWGSCLLVCPSQHPFCHQAPYVLRIHRRRRTLLLLVTYLLYSVVSAAFHVAAFSLRPPPSRLCYPAHGATAALHRPSWTPRHAVPVNPESNLSAPKTEDSAAGAGGFSQIPQMQKSGVTAPMRHMPRGTRLIRGFPGPQFVSLGPSVRYRRRLRRHRRDEGWQFSNLPGKRIFFAARRNHRDQLMHSWIYTQHKQCHKKAKDIIRKLQSQSLQIFGPKEGTEATHGKPLERETEPPHEDAQVVSNGIQGIQDTGTFSAIQNVNLDSDMSGRDCLSAMRAALEACPPPEILRTLSAEALGNMHSTLRELLIDVVVAVAPPELVASAATLGFSLPPATAAVAASPMPWWNSRGGLQPWRGRKEARGQQSRRVNWANSRRSVEPTVAGVLLPKEAAAVVAAERKARTDEVLDALRSFYTSPDGNRAKGNANSKQTVAHEASDASAASLPWFVSAEDERLQGLLGWDKTPAEQGESNALARPSMQDTTHLQRARGKMSPQQRQNTPGGFYALRRALGAAIDVALLLTEASVTKKSGAAAPYSWDSPFLRSAASSRRRRWRERGRPPPGERLPTRQSRRLSNRKRRLAG